MNEKTCLIWVFMGAIFAGSALITLLLIEFHINFFAALLYSMPFIIAVAMGGGFMCYRLSLKRNRASS